MSKAFQQALNFVLQWEGGFSHHPADPGGATNFGITQGTYDDYRGAQGLEPQSVAQIEREEAEAIYKNKYWKAVRGDELPDALAIALFDGAVHMGESRAIRQLQAEVGVPEDGHLGPLTMQAIRAVFADDKNSTELLTSLLQHREDFYREIATGAKKVFLKGWLNRLSSLQHYLDSYSAN